jgi:hypothetical protein
MTTTTRSPLGGFEEQLLGELREIVAQRARQAPATRVRRHWRRGAVAGLAFVCASGTLGGLALAGTFSATAINPQAWVDGQRVQPEPAIAADQAAELGILRRPRVASDALSPLQIADLTDSPTAANGPDPALSRRAQGITEGAAWVIPGDGMICFEYEAVAGALGGGTCQPDASITNGDWPIATSMSIREPGMTGVAGLVPDGVTQVTLTLSDGTTLAVPVHENVYLAAISGGLSSLTYSGPNGTVTLHN